MSYKKLFDLTNKVAVVIGGTGLIGSSFIEGLAEFGAKIVVADIIKEKCEKKAEEIGNKYKVGNMGVEINIAKKESINEALSEILLKFKRVDILVNCAQAVPKNFAAKFEDYNEEDIATVLDVDLKGVLLCCQAFGKQMIKQGGGNIINIASTYGVVSPNQALYENDDYSSTERSPAVYSAAKGGIIMLTKYLATYWGGSKIRVNAITPHGVYRNHEKGFVTGFSKLSPLRRMSQAKEVVGALIYLASDASSYVTGANILVEGGWTAW